MENNDLTIRPYDAATDLTTLSNIWFDASLNAHPFIGRPRLTEQRRLIEDEYLPKAETWVASREGKTVGFISLLGTFVGGLFVSPDAHRTGIGRRLIAYALDRKGELTLEVYTQNQEAVRFYDALGFEGVSRRDVDDFGYPFPNITLQVKG